MRRSQSRTRPRPTGSAGPRRSRDPTRTCAPRSSPSLSWSAGLRPPSATVHAGRSSAASERSHRPHGWRVPRPRRVCSRSVRSRLPNRSPRHPATSTFGASRPYFAIAETHLANGDIERAEQAVARPDCERGSAAERRGRSRSPPVSCRPAAREARGDWAAAGRMLARSAEAAGDEGLICERWQIEAGLAAVAAAADSLTDAEETGGARTRADRHDGRIGRGRGDRARLLPPARAGRDRPPGIDATRLAPAANRPRSRASEDRPARIRRPLAASLSDWRR